MEQEERGTDEVHTEVVGTHYPEYAVRRDEETASRRENQTRKGRDTETNTEKTDWELNRPGETNGEGTTQHSTKPLKKMKREEGGDPTLERKWSSTRNKHARKE